MQTLKALYRDAIIIFIMIIFGLGIGQLARKAIITNEWFKECFGLIAFSFIIAIPITIYRLVTNTKPPFCDDVLSGLTTILLSAVMVYTGFVVLGTILTL
jgi:hypothetical protein